MIDTEALRKKVIDLAIQGKLTQQLQEDGNAEDLYAQIQEEKAKLIKKGKIKNQTTKDVTEDVPFDIPTNWKWVRVGDIEEINLGFTYRPEYVDDGVYFLSAKDITGGKVDFSEAKKVSFETYEKAAYGSKPHKGDILFCRVGTIGKPQVIYDDVDFCIFVSLGFFRDHFNLLIPEYIVQWMNSKLFERQVDIEVKGALQRNLNTGWLKEFLVPLPPYAEQKRIVEKIEEILAQIEIIDAFQQQYESDREILKGKIIDAGIRGKFTEQLPEDGDAEDLYAQIQEEKTKLIKEGKIKKEKPLPPISEDEIPFEIPKNWKWVRVADIAFLSSGKAYEETIEGELYIKVSDMNLPENKTQIVTSTHFVSVNNDGIIPMNSIIFPKRGGAIATNKKRMILQNPVFVDLNTMGMTVILTDVLMYVKYWFDTVKLNEIQNGTAIPQVNNMDIYPLVLPLPPLEEQKRIVDRINELMGILTLGASC